MPLRISFVGRAEIKSPNRVPVARKKKANKRTKKASNLQTQRATVAKKLEKPNELPERVLVTEKVEAPKRKKTETLRDFDCPPRIKKPIYGGRKSRKTCTAKVEN